MGRGDSLAEDGEFKLLDSCSDIATRSMASQSNCFAMLIQWESLPPLRPLVGYLKDAAEEIH